MSPRPATRPAAADRDHGLQALRTAALIRLLMHHAQRAAEACRPMLATGSCP